MNNVTLYEINLYFLLLL